MTKNPSRVALDHCVIHVSDWERSNAFYRSVLGADVVPVGRGFAYRFGSAQLNLHGPGLTPTPVARIPVAPGGSDLCFAWPGTAEKGQGASGALRGRGGAVRHPRQEPQRLLPRPGRLAAGADLVPGWPERKGAGVSRPLPIHGGVAIESALAELEAAPRLGLAVLLALDLAVVAGEEAALLE